MSVLDRFSEISSKIYMDGKFYKSQSTESIDVIDAATENKIGEIPIVEDKYNKALFALKVNGDSMIDAGIHDEDIVVVDKNIEPKNGDIGAFMINDTEATVKYLDTISGKKYLIPANKNYENFEVNENTQPIGKVVSLFRDI